MAQTTWKQVVYDVADAWREANDSTAKIPIGELPNKVKEGGENIDPELTTLESTLQEILDILPFKGFQNSGQYVWKKFEYEQVLASEIIVTQIQGGGADACIIKFSSDKIDFSTIDDSFFVGMKLTYTGPRVVNLYANNMAGFESSTSGHSWTWNPSTQQMRFSFTGSSNVTWAITSPASFGVKNITGYVVSSDIEAYPDGGEQDGYWYELVKEGIDLIELFSLTRISIDTYVPSSDIVSSNTTIPHSLCVIPKVAIVSGKPSHLAGNLETAFAYFNTSGSGYSTMIRQENTGYTVATGNSSDTKATTNTVKLSHSSTWFKAGVEYTVITGV